MKAKKTTRKTAMTDAEIKEAIRRDKEWMDNIDPDDGIVVSKGALKDIFGDSIQPVPPETLLAIIEEGGNFGHYEQSRKAALSGETRERKIDTAKRYIRRLPFALKYAPREAFRYFLDLVLGNFKKKNPS